MSTKPIVDARAVHKHFGALHVLKGVDLKVAERELVFVIGPSGSGKSTLLRCLNRLEEPSSGSIVVDGIDLGIVGALQIALKLKVVGRICEHKIDAIRGELIHLGDAIADDDAMLETVFKLCAGRLQRRPATRTNHDSLTLTQATLSATRDQTTD